MAGGACQHGHSAAKSAVWSINNVSGSPNVEQCPDNGHCKTLHIGTHASGMRLTAGQQLVTHLLSQPCPGYELHVCCL